MSREPSVGASSARCRRRRCGGASSVAHVPVTQRPRAASLSVVQRVVASAPRRLRPVAFSSTSRAASSSSLVTTMLSGALGAISRAARSSMACWYNVAKWLYIAWMDQREERISSSSESIFARRVVSSIEASSVHRIPLGPRQRVAPLLDLGERRPKEFTMEIMHCSIAAIVRSRAELSIGKRGGGEGG